MTRFTPVMAGRREVPMRIGELAARAGVSVRALRYYEEQGLLAARRSPGGQRHYAESALERVLLIRELYAAGLSSRTVLELLPCIESHEVTAELLDRLAAERDRIERRIRDLTDTRDRLDHAIALAATARATGRPCPR